MWFIFFHYNLLLRIYPFKSLLSEPGINQSTLAVYYSIKPNLDFNVQFCKLLISVHSCKIEMLLLIRETFTKRLLL